MFAKMDKEMMASYEVEDRAEVDTDLKKEDTSSIGPIPN